MRRAGWLLLVVVAGCSSSTKSSVDAGSCQPGRDASCACQTDAQCGSPLLVCDVEVTKTCVFSCQHDSDCTDPGAPADVRNTCSGDPLGCACELDRTTGFSHCLARACFADSACPAGERCRGGQCTSQPDPQATACALEPAKAVLAPGDNITFTVESLVPEVRSDDAAAYQLSSSSGALITVDGGATFSAAAQPDGGAVTITATRGSASCTATVQVLEPLDASTSLRVLVVDADTGEPIDGAVVQVEGAAPATAAAGVATFAALPAAPWTVSVFDADHDYATYVGVQRRDLRIELARDRSAALGGLTGNDLNATVPNAQVHFGLEGLSASGALSGDFYGRLLGATVPLSFDIASQGFRDVPLREGTTLGLNDTAYKGSYRALAGPTACPGAGACGVRTTWAIQGDAPPAALVFDAQASFDFAEVLFDVGPQLGTWQLHVQRDTQYPVGPALPDGGAAPENLVAFDQPGASEEALTLSTPVDVDLGSPPLSDGVPLARAVALAAAVVPGRGLVPLGLGASRISGVDAGQPRYADDEGKQGGIRLHQAPVPASMNGAPIIVAVLASNDLFRGPPTSGMLVRPAVCGASSSQGICFEGVVNATADFLDVPAPASFDAAARALHVGAPVADENLQRVIFTAANGRRWTVLSAPGDVTLPTPPAGSDDRLPSAWILQALDAQRPLDDLLGFQQDPLGQVDGAVARFANRAGEAP